jgi:hypothetical protein
MVKVKVLQLDPKKSLDYFTFNLVFEVSILSVALTMFLAIIPKGLTLMISYQSVHKSMRKYILFACLYFSVNLNLYFWNFRTMGERLQKGNYPVFLMSLLFLLLCLFVFAVFKETKCTCVNLMKVLK